MAVLEHAMTERSPGSEWNNPLIPYLLQKVPRSARRDLLREILKPRGRSDLFNRMPLETALEYLRLARESGEPGWVDEARHLLRRDPDSLRHMAPETALEYLRLARESGEPGWVDEARHLLRRDPD